MKISFKPLANTDFENLLKWLQQPHVKKWWDANVNYTKEAIQEKYGSYVDGYKKIGSERKPIHAFIIYFDDIPIGSIQYYNAYDFPRDGYQLNNLPKSLAAIDMFIGDENYLGKGIGALVLELFLDSHVFTKFDYAFVDPDGSNLAAIKTYENAGFHRKSNIGKALLLKRLENESIDITFITKQVLENAHYAKLAMETYEGIGDGANDLRSTRFEFFFGFNQKAMLDFIILQICKLYDKPNKKYKKHTVFEIVEYLKKNKELADYQGVCAPNLNNYFNKSCFKKKCESDLSNIEDFLNEAECIIDKLITSDSFDRLKTFRDKYIAHAEKLNTGPIKHLPSIDRMDEFINIAIDLSILIHNLFSHDSSLDRSTSSMKTATQNLIKNIVDKDHE